MGIILLGKKVKLATVDPSKVSLMNEWFNDTFITRNLHWGIRPTTIEKSTEFAENTQQPTEDRRVFSINALDLAKGEESYIGHIELHQIDWLNRVAELGIVIGKQEYLNKGYGTDAMRTLLHFAFMEMNLNRVTLRHKAFNERGHQAYLKVGFIEEGRMRQQIFRNGRYWDMVIMGILKEEFLQMKQ